MPSIKDLWPDKWLKAEHLTSASGARPIVSAEIVGAGVENLYNSRSGKTEPRLIVEFRGKDKRLILNKTQAATIAEIARTDNYTAWRGVAIRMQAGIAHNGKPTIQILAPTMTPTPTNTNGKAETMAPTNTNGHDPDPDHDPDPNHNQEEQEQDQ